MRTAFKSFVRGLATAASAIGPRTLSTQFNSGVFPAQSETDPKHRELQTTAISEQQSIAGAAPSRQLDKTPEHHGVFGGDPEQEAHELTAVIEKDKKSGSLSIDALTAILIKTLENSILRQAASNVGLHLLSDKKESLTPGFLFSGAGKRFIGNLLNIPLSMAVQDEMKRNGFSPLATTAAATTVDTGFGTFLEVYASKEALEKLGPKLTTKQMFNLSLRATPAWWARNFCTWVVASLGDELTLTQKSLLGGVGGAISSPFHTLGQLLVMEGGEKTAKEAFSNVVEKIKANPRILGSGAMVRMLAGIASAVALSGDNTKFLEARMKEVADLLNPLLSTASLDSTSKIPPVAVDPIERELFDDLPEKDRLKYAGSVCRAIGLIATTQSPKQEPGTPPTEISKPNGAPATQSNGRDEGRLQ